MSDNNEDNQANLKDENNDFDTEDDLLSQAYDQFLKDNPSNTAFCSTSPSIITKETEDLVTLEDLIGPDNKKDDSSIKTLTLEVLLSPSYNPSLYGLIPEDTENIQEIDVSYTNGDKSIIPKANPVLNDKQEMDVSYTNDDNSIVSKANPILHRELDGDLPESSTIATLIVLEIFDDVLKRIKTTNRWKTKDPKYWKRNLAKKRRSEGLPYMTNSKSKAPKLPKPINCSRCHYKCTENISDDERKSLCRYYWNLNYVSKKNFILSNVTVKKVQRVKVSRTRKVRDYTSSCSFIVQNKQINVCQKFFLATLCIANTVLQDAIQKRNDYGVFSLAKDPRGDHEPANKTKDDVANFVMEHINSFPVMESHYVRKETQRRYLDKNLSIGKMYDLYVKSCAEKENMEPVSQTTYRRMFATYFNLGFFVPKKDQCLLCNKYARYDSKNVCLELKKNYDSHIKRRDSCNAEKNKDKVRAESNKKFMSVTFDLQAVLQIPSGDIGELYYTRKLNVFNLTIYESALPNDAYCFTWNETNGKKGSCEIGTIFLYYLQNCIPNHVNEISLFSDTCGGQNRNQYIAAILLWAVQKIEHLDVIEQKFLESGHTHMEGDSMHSSIESAKRYSSIYSMTEWKNIFKRARSKAFYRKDKQKVKKNPYHVKELKFDDFKDLKKLAEDTITNRTKTKDGEKVQWLKIKRIRYVKGKPNNIYFNYDMSNEFYCIDVNSEEEVASLSENENVVEVCHNYGTRNARKRKALEADIETVTPQTNLNSKGELHQLYQKPLPISSAKKKDLLNLCRKGVIPEEFHAWFELLPSDTGAKDVLPELTLSDYDEDD